MTETLKVIYTKRATRKTAENYDTQEIGGEWEFTVPDGADIDQAYAGSFAVIKTMVDKHFEVPDVQAQPSSGEGNFERKSRELQQQVFSGEKAAQSSDSEYRTFAPGSTGADIVEGEAVYIENAKVWEVKEDKTRTGKRFSVVRVGAKDRIPTGYARVKSFEPSLINKMMALQETNHVDVWGHYESWMGRDSREGEPDTYMWDFVPERIEKVDN
jgi:hypothetical protein